MNPTQVADHANLQPAAATTIDGRWAITLSSVSADGTPARQLALEESAGDALSVLNLEAVLRSDLARARLPRSCASADSGTREGVLAGMSLAAVAAALGTEHVGSLCPSAVEEDRTGLWFAVVLECFADGSQPSRRLLGLESGPDGVPVVALVVDLEALDRNDASGGAGLDVFAYRALVASQPELLPELVGSFDELLAS